MIHGLVDNLEECEAAEKELAHAIAKADRDRLGQSLFQ
jgi:hypothetical protein